MPVKTYLIEGTNESIEQIFTTPSKALTYKNVGLNPVQMHMVSTSPAYNIKTVVLPRSQEDFESLEVIVDRVKFTFTKKSKIEFIEEY